MSRVANDLPSGSKNPAARFLEWKAKEGVFSYYDSGAGENVTIELPFKFAFLEHYHTVRGWDDKSDSRMFSNEVLRIGSQELSVRSFKGGDIASGLYRDIKPTILERGGKYHRSIYVMSEDGEMLNITIKGGASAQWSDFYDSNKSEIFSNWVEVNGTVEGKKGSVKWNDPVFNIGKKLSNKDDAAADALGAKLAQYFNDKFGAQPQEADKEAVVEEAVVEEFDNDEVAF